MISRGRFTVVWERIVSLAERVSLLERNQGLTAGGLGLESRVARLEALEASHLTDEKLYLEINSGDMAFLDARSCELEEQAATLAERERIVAEIHDGLAQTLSFLGLRLGVLEGAIEEEDLSKIPEHLALMQHTVEQASLEARRLMAGLQASTHPSCSLEDLLGQTVETFIAERGMEIELRVEAAEPIGEPLEVREQVIRVVQEALTNVHKHAGSGRATVTLKRHGGQTVVSVRDDGVGFDVDSPASGQYHFGLTVMRTRAERIGGELSVGSAPGQGTTVTLRWPALRQPFDHERSDAQDGRVSLALDTAAEG